MCEAHRSAAERSLIRHAFATGCLNIVAFAAVSLTGSTSLSQQNESAAVPGNAARAEPSAELKAEQLFAQKVWPLLSEKCLACHGGDEKEIKGEFDLRTRAGLLRGGESGEAALVPGRPDESPLHTAVARTDPAFVMPPKENDKLSAEQVAWIRQWIAAGAPWPSEERIAELKRQPSVWDEADGVAVPTSGGLSPEWTNRKYKPENLWAYQPLKKPRAPKQAIGLPAANAIDSFINERLSSLGLQPAPRADRRTLIRRATFDLTGLPPTPDEIADYLNDPAPDDVAFAHVVDRLLASPHYGEKWAQHWLDVVRYADSSGFANDYERGNAWRYRDYVARAFNADKPYDQFVREQIAGDEIDANDPELLVAVGFLRMGPWELTGMEVPKVARQRFLDDVTDAVGQVFLAHPLQCARCHDHKFDPVPTRDYYRIQAVFATTQLAERSAAFLPEENTAGFEQRKYLEARKARYEAVLRGINAKQDAAARKWCEERGLEYVPRARGLRQGISEDKLPPARIGLETRDLGMERIARKGLERLKWEFERYQPFALSVYSGRTPMLRSVSAPLRVPNDRLQAGELEETSILAGGDVFSPKEPVTPGVLSAVDRLNVSDLSHELDQIPTTFEGRRKALAEWIVSPHNPLTARVIVNRIWQWHFGQGIAGNSNNFGATGKKPTHPELLDWLAAEFIERGWSIEAMHRLIMTSEAYRRSSVHPDPAALAAKDPGGTSYAVFHPRRLTAEELRDAMLAVSGELNHTVGGIPVRPEMNCDAALQPRQVMGTFTPAWQPSPLPSQRHRRSIYALKLRGLRDPFFEVFNQPGSENSCELRDATTVTPQVFSLFNSQASYDRALAFAARLLAERRVAFQPARSDVQDNSGRLEAYPTETVIRRAFELALGRSPDSDEMRICVEHWNQMTERHRSTRFERPNHLREVALEAVEENTGEKFTFTEVLDAYDDFVPDLKPADVGPKVRGLAEVCLVLFNSNEFAYVD